MMFTGNCFVVQANSAPAICLGTEVRVDGRGRGPSVHSVHRGARAMIVAAPCVEMKRLRYRVLLFGSFVGLLSNINQARSIKNNRSFSSQQSSLRK